MSIDTDTAVLDRINKRIADLGLTEAGAAKAAGLGASAIRNIREGKSQAPRLDTMRKLAPVLKVAPEWLAFGVDEDLARAQAETAATYPFQLPVIGEVAAGRWLEVDEFIDEPAFEPVSITPDRRWPVEHQFGLKVHGDSINRFARDGDVIICVAAAPTRYRPKQGDLIVVEMCRAAGMLRQRTAKRFARRDTHIELWPDSDHERWQKPIIIPKQLSALEYFLDDDEGRISVVVSAFVTTAVRSVQKWRLPRSAELLGADE